MPLIYIVLVLIVVGMALWLVNVYIPMAGSIKTILNAVGRDRRLRLGAQSRGTLEPGAELSGALAARKYAHLGLNLAGCHRCSGPRSVLISTAALMELAIASPAAIHNTI